MTQWNTILNMTLDNDHYDDHWVYGCIIDVVKVSKEKTNQGKNKKQHKPTYYCCYYSAT